MSAAKVEIRPLKVHTGARGAVFEPLELALLVSFNTEEHDPASADAERVELIS